MNIRHGFTALMLAALPLLGGDLTPEVQVKFIRILANSAGAAGKVACKDSAIEAEFGKAGLSQEASAKVAWAASEKEVKAFKAAGKLVICGHLEWLPAGGAIAIVEEGGKPQIYLHMGNIANSGAVLSDAVLKIGRKL